MDAVAVAPELPLHLQLRPAARLPQAADAALVVGRLAGLPPSHRTKETRDLTDVQFSMLNSQSGDGELQIPFPD